MPETRYSKITLETSKQLREFLRQKRGKKVIYRGHSDAKYELDPSIFRPAVISASSDNERLAKEKSLLRYFKKWARPYFTDKPSYSDDWHWLALARHYELPTRLLDWSESAGVALYFAVQRDKECDATLWCSERPEIVDSSSLLSPFDIGDIRLYEPSHIAIRITVQRSCFTVHPTDYKSRPVKWPVLLEEIRIRASLREEIRLLLEDFGINRMALFPGPTGIAAYLRSNYA